MRKGLKILLFLQVCVNFDQLIVVVLCPFLKVVPENVEYECGVVCLI